MLITCPECNLQVSDKAFMCPHCGYILNSKLASKATTNKRRRLPNGFGQITKIKNKNLRNPYRVLVTIGKSDTGRPIVKPLYPKSYFATYNEAYSALVDFNKDPYDTSQMITMQELFDLWFPEYLKSATSRTAKNFTLRVWRYCTSIHEMRAADVKIRHLKNCIENGLNKHNQPLSFLDKEKMKVTFNLMFDYAVANEIVEKNYARMFSLSDAEKHEVKREHIIYSEEEMHLLWKNLYVIPDIDMILIQCYSGWRPQELINLALENIDFEKKIFFGGMKTEAGKNRKVPIHSKIESLVRKRYDEAFANGSKFLFNKCGFAFNYNSFKSSFEKIVKVLDLNKEHRPHDGRKHFVTMAKKYKVDEFAIKYFVGHTISDITEKVYTTRDDQWFHEEIEKIK